MSFLRRLLGGSGATDSDGDDASRDGDGKPASPADLVADEQARERELLLEEARRLDDDLIQRQLRYADRAWQPPAQGGIRRADDEDAKAD